MIYATSVQATIPTVSTPQDKVGISSIKKTSSTVITDLSFSQLKEGRVQVQLVMDKQTVTPKIFKTDNPARIILDFYAVKSALAKKKYTVNQGVANSIYVIEVSGRTRVIINLKETTAFKTEYIHNKMYVTLDPQRTITTATISNKNTPPPKQRTLDRSIAHLFPMQSIKNIDFSRGQRGDGRLLFELSTVNTLVKIKAENGKVVLNFINTKLPKNLAKNYDVTDFATPVHKFIAQTKGNGVNVIITPHNSNFKYESHQSDGLLTVNFIPLSVVEVEKENSSVYSGDKLSLNFHSIPVKSALYILADVADLNIISSDSVDADDGVSLRLNDVPWDQALSLILKSKGLTQRRENNIILVSSISDTIINEQQELESNITQQNLEVLHTEYIKIHYAKAVDIFKIITGDEGEGGGAQEDGESESSDGGVVSSFLSLRGTLYLDERTRTIIIKDTAERIKAFKEMVAILDVPVQQVMIEARIVTANTGFAQEIGVKFGVAKLGRVGSNKTFLLQGAGQDVQTSNILNSNGPLSADAGFAAVANNSYLFDLGASAIGMTPAGALGLTLARAADYVLNLELSALANDNKGQMLANPRVMTSDNEPSYIKQGVRIPYTVSNGNTNNNRESLEIEYIEAVLELNVTPQITPDGDVIMDLLIKNDNPAAGTVIGQFTPIEEKEIKTIVRVKDGETIMLGGVYEGASSKDMYKIPFLSDLPIIGFLFTKKSKSNTKTELLIFITPKIVRDTLTPNVGY